MSPIYPRPKQKLENSLHTRIKKILNNFTYKSNVDSKNTVVICGAG